MSDEEKHVLKKTSDDEFNDDKLLKSEEVNTLIPPELFIRDPSEEDIYCSAGIVTPLTLNIAKKMEKMIKLGIKQTYSTLYGQSCLFFDNCKIFGFIIYGKLYIDNKLYKIPFNDTSYAFFDSCYYYATFPSDTNTNPIFATGSGMDPVYLFIDHKNQLRNHSVWGNIKDHAKEYYYKDKTFRFVKDNIGISIKIIGKDTFIDIFNKHNRTHYKQYNDMMLDNERLFTLTRNPQSLMKINVSTKKYCNDLKVMNDNLYSNLFRMSSISCIEEYLVKNIDIVHIDIIVFEMYMYIKKIQSVVLEEKKCIWSYFFLLPIDIIKMINDRILS